MNKNSSILWWTLILSIVLSGLHLLASILYLYWIYWWYDVVMHFITGFTLGLLVYWLMFVSGLFFGQKVRSFWSTLLPILVVVMFIALTWEYFEYVYNITDSHEGYLLDTLIDLFLAAFGSGFATFISYRKNSTSINHTING